LKIGGALTLLLILYCATPPPGLRLRAFHWLTGLDCPLCGLTRALFALAKGRWAEALGYHALAPLAAAMLLALLCRGRWVARLWTAGLVMFAVYGVWRIVV
jgi:hypothetical protein